MHEKTLLKLSIIASITGISLLYILLQFKTPELLNPTDPQIDETILTSGKITAIKEYNSSTIITIQPNNKINLVIFDRIPPIKKYDIIEVRGKYSEEDSPQIIAEEIRVI